MGFTPNQIKAINSDKSNILVSASAGSGKTTVLVERVIKRILEKENPVDIDKMLILTFTKAAAAQMREKILKAIEDKLSIDPYNVHLQRQSVLVLSAQISTFHGFCQEIIKNHFYEIDADPMLRVADEGEVKLMQMDVLNSVLEAAYESKEEGFLRVVESYCSSKNDKNLEDIILGIYNISQAQLEPDSYLDMCEEAYNIKDEEELKNTKWFVEYVDYLRDCGQNAVSIANKMIMLCDYENGPVKYRKMFEEDLAFAKGIEKAKSFDDIKLLCKVHERIKLAPISSKDGVDDELKKRAALLRDSFYDITDAVSASVRIDLEKEVSVMQSCRLLTRAIIALVRDFSKGYADKKIENGVIDFNDMEHLAIKILKNSDGNTARIYRDKFVQIYVDEYQDSNLTQEEIVRLVSKNNVFMVGDVKQSIYRFRMARPDLFLNKYKAFIPVNDITGDDYGSLSDGEGVVIDLSDNFRSRSEVLSSANEIFSQIMTRELGGIIYDDAASLHYGHAYDDYLREGYESELILCSSNGELSRAETEASAIATRINQLVGKMDIYDENIKAMRKLKYSDIVILLRSMSGRDNIYRDVLKSFNIPAYVTVSTGYFASTEIDTLLNFLSVIDNPLKDVELAAVLRSPIGGFSDEELAIIRGNQKADNDKYKDCVYLYDVLLAARGDNKKIDDFLRYLEGFRLKSEYLSVYEILREIIDGEYGDIVRSKNNGSQAKANLNMLLKKAEDFGRLSYKGLFHFLRYIDQIKKYEIDYGEAGITDDDDCNVKIMTIHKSKGLEFPVVFVSALSKKRNDNDEKSDIIADPNTGLGLTYVDIDKRLKQKTILKDYMLSRLKNENLSEEIRVLYVALTRAKEKLILVADANNPAKDFYEKNKPLNMCNTYLDMLALAHNAKGYFSHMHVCEMGLDDFVIKNAIKELDKDYIADRIGGIIRGEIHTASGKIDELRSILDYEYPFDKEAMIPSKVSVSELKKASLADKEIEPGEIEYHSALAKKEEAYVPDFVREDKEANNGGTFYGTAFHRMCELWDYSISLNREEELSWEEISKYFERMRLEGKIDAVQLKAVNVREIQTFIKCEASKRMALAAKEDKLYREQPFTLGKWPGPTLIQGIIDAYWIEDNEIVILDYKTDRVDSKEELISRYKVQLDYYEEALSKLLNLKVKEKIIYSTRLKEIVKL